jgi:hypothetical protein
MRRERARECRGRTEATQNGSRVCEKLHSCTAMAGGGPPSGGSMEADFRGVWPRRRTCARAGQAEGRALGGGGRPQRLLVCVRNEFSPFYTTERKSVRSKAELGAQNTHHKRQKRISLLRSHGTGQIGCLFCKISPPLVVPPEELLNCEPHCGASQRHRKRGATRRHER